MTDVSLRYLLFGEDRTASAAVKGVENVATRSGQAVGDAFSKMGNAIGGEVGEVLNKAGEGIAKITESMHGMGPALTAGGAAIAGIGAALTAMGSKEKEAQNAIKAAIEGTGKSYDDYKDKIEEVVKQQENYAFSAKETQNALATLTTATKDPEQALDKMGMVADLAASRHISLNAAAKLVGKAINGNTALFKQYGIQVKSITSANAALTKAQNGVEVSTEVLHEKQAGLAAAHQEVRTKALSGKSAQDLLTQASKDLAKATEDLAKKQQKLMVAQEGVKTANDQTAAAMDEVTKRNKGQAAASVDSIAGKFQVMKTKVEDTVGMLGQKFGPAITVAGTAISMYGGVLDILAAREARAAAAAEAQTAATEGQGIAAKAAAGAQWLLNAAMDANPVVLIIAALVGLVAIFVLLYKHSTTFRNAMNAAFHAVTAAAMAAFDWIKQHWPLILAILTGPVGVAVLFIVKNWDKIRAGFGNALDGVKALWHSFTGFLGGLGSKVSSAVGGMWSGIKDGFKAVLNGVIDVWNSMPSFKIPSISIAGHKVGGGTIGLPHLNHLAVGGVLTSSGAIVVGEHGREILDMPAGARVRPLSAMDTHGASPAGGGDLGTLTVDITQDGVVIARKLAKLKRDRGGLKLEFEDA